MGGQVDDATMDLMMSQGKGAMGMSQGQFAQRRAQEMKIRDRSDPKQILERMKRKVHSSVFGGVEELGAKAYNAIGQAYDDMIDDLVGRHIVELSKEGAKTFENAMSGGSKSELKEMVAAANGLRVGGDGKIEAKMTAGRMAKLAVAGVVGLGVGVATGFNPLAGGAAAMGTMALLSGWDAENSDMSASLRSAGLAGSTGRTASGKRARMEELTGLTGDKLDAYLASDREGKRVGGAAEEAFRSIRAETAGQHGRSNWEGYDKDAQLEYVRQATLENIASGMGVIGSGRSAHGVTAAELGSGKWDTARYEDTIKRLEGRGEHAKAAMVRAAQGTGMELGMGVIEGVKQEGGGGYAEVRAAAASGGEIASLAALQQAGAGFKDAQSGLRDIFGTEAGVLESNPNLRKAAMRALSDPAVFNAINAPGAEGGVAALQKLGISVTGAELQQLRGVLSKAGDKDKAKGALSKYTTAKGSKDYAAILKQVGETGEELAGATNKAVKGLSDTMKAAYGGKGSLEDVEKAQMALIDEYQATEGNATARSELEKQMTPAMVAALKKGDKIKGSQFAGKGKDSVIEQLKKTYGASMSAETLNSVMSGVGLGGSVTKDEAERLRDRLANLEINKTITGSAGGQVATHEDKMLAALSLQTELLGLMVKDKMGDDPGMTSKLDALRADRKEKEKLGS
jgi:hypothetical protein